MPQRRKLLALCFIGWFSASAFAADDPRLLLAATNVITTNLQGGALCKGAVSESRRPDRLKLAALVADVPDPNADYPFDGIDFVPLDLAVLADDVELLDSLFSRGARWRQDASGGKAMVEAAQHGSPAMVAALMHHGLAANIRQPGGWTPLMAAAWADRLDNVNALLEAGADVGIALPNGNSALNGAVFCKNQAMVDALIQRGARPDAKTRHRAKELGIDLPAS